MLQTDNCRLGVGLLKMGSCPTFHFGKCQNIMIADEGTIEARSAHRLIKPPFPWALPN